MSTKLTETRIRRLVRNVIKESFGPDYPWETNSVDFFNSPEADEHYKVWSQDLADAYGEGYLNFSSDFQERFPGHEGWSEELAQAYGPGYLNYSGDLRSMEAPHFQRLPFRPNRSKF